MFFSLINCIIKTIGISISFFLGKIYKEKHKGLIKRKNTYSKSLIVILKIQIEIEFFKKTILLLLRLELDIIQIKDLHVQQKEDAHEEIL